MAVLIAFYSRAGENYFSGNYRNVTIGNTEKAAKMIAEMTGGKLFRIEQEVPYSESYKVCIAQAKEDLNCRARPKLLNRIDDFSNYDEIYLGYPNYWGTMPMAVYSFLENSDFKGKTIHPFCTHEGSGLSNTVKDIQNEVPDANVTSGLSIHGSEVDYAEESIQEWIRGFRR